MTDDSPIVARVRPETFDHPSSLREAARESISPQLSNVTSLGLNRGFRVTDSRVLQNFQGMQSSVDPSTATANGMKRRAKILSDGLSNIFEMPEAALLEEELFAMWFVTVCRWFVAIFWPRFFLTKPATNRFLPRNS